MYGTIFTLKVKPGQEDRLLKAIDRGIPNGMIAWFLMRPDNEHKDLTGVAIFESKDAAMANANSPEQNKSFSEAMEHLVAEPSWIDGEFIAGGVA